MWKRTTIIIGVVAAVASVSGCSVMLLRALSGDPLPVLLQNLKASGGIWDGCPANSSYEAHLQANFPSAESPELNSRLRKQFPVGSDDVLIIDGLKQQGFRSFSVCASDKSVKEADFKQVNGLTPARSSVYWKVDKFHHIEWTRGFIAYDGP